ncbi:MAG: GNAT family N-acetyltransferase [Bacteroidota bacterium]
MTTFTIKEVNDKTSKKQFFDCARKIYADDPHWVCPLDIEIESIFDPAHNMAFKHGDAVRWIIVDDNNQPAGRIAAFYHKEKAMKHKPYAGGIGFFESVNNQDVANMLFDKARDWLTQQGMEAMDGPINFGENFLYWGLLLEGFTHQAYGMQYHKPYYKDLFENYGFKIYYKQFSYHVDLTKPFNERQVKFARFIGRKKNYTFRHLKTKQADKFIDDIVFIFNTVWSDFHEDYTPLEKKDIEHIFEDAKDVIIEDFIWLAYDNDKPIGLLVPFPDVNQVIKPFNGKLNLLNKLRFIRRRKNPNVVSRARLLISGVIPEYQRTGIIGPLFIKMVETLKQHGIKELEMSWVGDYNDTVNKLYKQMHNTRLAKTHATYRYLFDRNAEFVRFTNEKAPKQNNIGD